MILSEALKLIKSGASLTSNKFNSPDFEYIEYDERFVNPIRFIARDGYNSPIDLQEDNDYRFVEKRTNNDCCEYRDFTKW
jgi:hypothetical protein